MTTQQDALYYQTRAEAELRQAKRSIDPHAARIHEKLAEMYRERIVGASA